MQNSPYFNFNLSVQQQPGLVDIRDEKALLANVDAIASGTARAGLRPPETDWKQINAALVARRGW